MNSSNRYLHMYSFRHSEVLICLLLVISILFVFAQVHDFEFVNYDDTDYVSKNVNVQKGLTAESIVLAFTTVHAANWHPLTWLSHMTDYQLFGLNAGMHHLTNLFFHIINTLLLFFVFRKMTGAVWQSAFVAALFALHPLHVESVAWVSERKDVLSAFFWMLSMGCYAAYVARPSVLKYLGVIVFLALGLMSKPMLVTLPCVLLLIDYWPLKRFSFQGASGNEFPVARSTFKLLWEKIPLFVLAAISSIITYFAQQQGGAVKSLEFIPFADRVANALVSYILYIDKMIYPGRLAILYPHPETLPWWQVLTAGLLLLSISAIVVRASKTRSYLAVGWLWYLGTLVPVIGLVQVGGQSMADRYTYLPLIGLFIMIAWGVPDVLRFSRFRKEVVGVCSVIILLIFSGITWKQTGYWRNSITLFEHAVDVTDHNYSMHYNLGNVLAEKGQTQNALNHYQQALEIKPDFADARNNMANLYLQMENPEAAAKNYLKVLAINPGYDGARYNLGIALNDQGRPQEAVPYFLAALKMMPENADAHFKTGNALFTTGDIDAAIRHYQQAVRINPGFVNAYCNLGVALFQEGKVNDAIDAFKSALRVQPDFKPARQYLQKALSVRSGN